MLAAIRRNRVWFQNNSVMKIGDAHGLPAGCFAECIRHMAAWTSLATSVARAEFPKFEVAMAFRIFALTEVSQDDRVAGLSIRPDMAGDFQVLASAFKVDAGDLWAEYESLFGIAQHIFRTERLAIRDVWSQAFQRVRRRANSQHGKKTRITGKIWRDILSGYCRHPASNRTSASANTCHSAEGETTWHHRLNWMSCRSRPTRSQTHKCPRC